MKAKKYMIAGLLLSMATISSVMYGRTQDEPVKVSHNGKKVSHQYLNIENVWSKLSNKQKDAVLQAIENDKEENADDVSVSMVREYNNALARREPAQAVMIYLRELPKSKQCYLLVKQAGLSEARCQEIIDVTGSAPEGSSTELMMYNDRDFFNMLD